ncbi:hypothetical protein DN585_06145 [Intrasporangium calvum]|nr:hypothetical protein DN585_06145 [Intrasporangium calvum]
MCFLAAAGSPSGKSGAALVGDAAGAAGADVATELLGADTVGTGVVRTGVIGSGAADSAAHPVSVTARASPAAYGRKVCLDTALQIP